MKPFVERLSRAIAGHVYAEIEAREAMRDPDVAGSGAYRGAVEDLEGELADVRAKLVEANLVASMTAAENAALRGEGSEAMNRTKKHSDLAAQIRKAIGALPGVMVMNNPQGVTRVGGRTIRYGLGQGSADLIACVDGRFVGIEVKSGDGALTAEQRAWAEALRAVGGIYREVRSVEDALAAVEEARP